MTRRSGLLRCVLRAGLVAALLIGFGLAPSVAPAVLAADGARVAGETTFVVQPEKHRVRARADVHLAYDRPERGQQEGGGIVAVGGRVVREPRQVGEDERPRHTHRYQAT